MKNIINKFAFSLLFLATVFLFGCKKDNEKPLDATNTSNSLSNEIVQKDGLISFKNRSEFYATLNKFGSMSADQRIQWSVNNNLKTQLIIWDELCKAQERFEKLKYAGLNEDISIQQMATLGYFPEFCPEIKNYESKGLIKLNTESDGSISFELSGVNIGMVGVLNESGLVLINDTLYQYQNNKTKFMKYTSISDIQTLMSATVSDLSNGIYVIIQNTRATNITIGNIFNQTSNDWIWYYNSSNERFNHYVTIYSYEYYVQFQGPRLNMNFWNISTAEKKLFGIWNTRKSYTPIMYIEGSWNWDMTPVIITPKPMLVGTGDTPYNSPLFYNFGSIGGTNFSTLHLHPSGQTAIFSGDDIEIKDMHIHGSFAGGPSGYNTNYFHN